MAHTIADKEFGGCLKNSSVYQDEKGYYIIASRTNAGNVHKVYISNNK